MDFVVGGGGGGGSGYGCQMTSGWQANSVRRMDLVHPASNMPPPPTPQL